MALDVSPFALVVIAFVSGAFGSLIGATVVIQLLRTGKVEARAIKLPRGIVALDKLHISLTVRGRDDSIIVSTEKHIEASSLSADVVEAWLEDNDLVAQFKGKDFSVPAPRGRTWQNTR